MMSLEVLATFAAVVDRGSVIGASQSCGYSPAAISRQMSALQRRLGVRLFEPEGRGIRPTAIAEDLAVAVRLLLAESDRFEMHVRHLCQTAASREHERACVPTS